MSVAMSCVKCGGPRASSLCAYCGTRYESDRPDLQNVSTTNPLAQFASLRIAQMQNDQQYAMAQIRARCGIYDSILGSFGEFGR